MSEDDTTNYHIEPHLPKTAPRRTYKTRNRICVTDVRNDGIKCVTEKCVTYTQQCSVGYKMRNCITA